MRVPITEADVQDLIAARVPEDLHLDDKQSRALHDSKRGDVAKDVSAFANSDGETLIYGVAEEEHLPKMIDGGVDHSRYSGEWLENVILGNITPRIAELYVKQIPLDESRSLYVVNTPRSVRGPHQASDYRYYKRYNFQSVPMEDYEIRDLRSRRLVTAPLVEIGLVATDFLVYLTVANIGPMTAENVRFALPSSLDRWLEEHKESIFRKGIKYLPPGRRFDFFYGAYNGLVAPGSPDPAEFDISVRYRHPVEDADVEESFHINLLDYWQSNHLKNDVERQGEDIRKAIEELTNQVKLVAAHVKALPVIADPTGLSLSVSTLRNLRHVMAGEDLEKLEPLSGDYEILREVLGLDHQVAFRVWNFFRGHAGGKALSEIDGVTPEILGS